MRPVERGGAAQGCEGARRFVRAQRGRRERQGRWDRQERQGRRWGWTTGLRTMTGAMSQVGSLADFSLWGNPLAHAQGIAFFLHLENRGTLVGGGVWGVQNQH